MTISTSSLAARSRTTTSEAAWRMSLKGLAPVAQHMVGKHQRYHRLGDRHSADADAGVMATLGDDIDGHAVTVQALDRCQDGGRRLDRHPRNDRLAGRYATQHAAGMIGEKLRLAIRPGAHPVSILDAGQARRCETVADLDPLTALIDMSALARSASSLP
nr:hypothetical protein [Hankyongella ginsenosidimutans]